MFHTGVCGWLLPLGAVTEPSPLQAPEPERAAQDAVGAGAERSPRGAAGGGVAAAGRVSQQRPPRGEVQDPHHKGTMAFLSSLPPISERVETQRLRVCALLPEGP